MSIRKHFASIASAGALVAAMPLVASALTVSCAGTPGVGSIVWSATPANGVAPYVYLWGNGSTSSSQTVSVTPGAYSTTIQVTDASSTVATSTCNATVLAAPTISSFTATPSSITIGQSSVLGWNVSGATSLSISGIGSVSGATTTVTPGVTTTYVLTAANSGGISTSSATVTVSAVGTTSPAVLAQIQLLLQQIATLKAQIAQLVNGAITGTGSTTPATVPAIRFCLETDHDMHMGDRGDDVRKLQQVLASDPTIFPEGQVTGFFGEKTLKAVKRFQKKFGSASTTGVVGPELRSLFKSHCGKGLVQVTNGSTTIGIPPGLLKGEDKSNKNRGRGHGEDD